MKAEYAQTLRDILGTQQVAALGTLHDGAPYVSMAPFALLPRGRGFVIHVSQLAAHTQDMLENPAVSLLVMATPQTGGRAQALARTTVQGNARRIGIDDPDFAEARQAYLQRFPQSEELFGFADFSLFVIRPRAIRFVGGFAQAETIDAEDFASIMSGRS